jgi:tetratricopeptide (TPR) repeat protein
MSGGLEVTNRQVKQLLEQQRTILEQLARNRGKDGWDKLATLSTFLSSIVIGVIGIYFANAYKAKEIAFKAQEVRIAETQLIEKFIPILAGTDESAKKGALLTVASLSNKDLAIRLGTSYTSAGTIEAMEILLKETEGENKNILRDSLIDALYSRAFNENSYFDQMISDIDKIFTLKSKDELKPKWDGYFLANCYRRRAYAYGGLGKYNLALDDLQESLKLIPNYSLAYSDLGNLYWRRTDAERSLDKALQYFDEAVKYMEKADGNIFFYRGQLYREMGRYDQALADFTKYIPFRPNDPMAYYEIAMVYQQKKDYSRAFHNAKKGREYATEPNQQAVQAMFDAIIEEIEGQMTVHEKTDKQSMPPVAPPINTDEANKRKRGEPVQKRPPQKHQPQTKSQSKRRV